MGVPARCVLKELHCNHVHDAAEDSYYVYWPQEEEFQYGAVECAVMIILYADDFIIAGNIVSATTIHRVLMLKLGFSKSEFGYQLRVAVRLERAELVPLPDGTRRCFVHQIRYTMHILDEYRKRHLNGSPLRMAATPMLEREEKDMDASVPDRVPNHTGEQAHWGGQLLWLCRGARKETCVTVKRLSGRYARWTRQEDKSLLRLMEYLQATMDLGLMFHGREDDIDHILVDLAVDSDLAGEVDTAKSTGGYDTVVAGPRTWIPTEWQCKNGTTTSRNTADAEMQSLDLGTFRSAIPTAYLLEQTMWRPVDIVGREDNAAVFLAVQRGYSRKLAYLAKSAKISISALHECYFGDPDEVGELKVHDINMLIKESTHTQRADILTKALGPIKHWENVKKLRMAFADELLDEMIGADIPT